MNHTKSSVISTLGSDYSGADNQVEMVVKIYTVPIKSPLEK